MPYIQVEILEATREQKDALIEKITDSVSSILGLDKQFIYVLIKENSTDNWGMGGLSLTKVFNKKEE